MCLLSRLIHIYNDANKNTLQISQKWWVGQWQGHRSQGWLRVGDGSTQWLVKGYMVSFIPTMFFASLEIRRSDKHKRSSPELKHGYGCVYFKKFYTPPPPMLMQEYPLVSGRWICNFLFEVISKSNAHCSMVRFPKAKTHQAPTDWFLN